MGPIRVSIIGSAGRLGDGERMSRDLFLLMVRKAEHLISNVFKLTKSDVTLISGGSAWADHVAVRLWLESVTDADSPDSFSGLRLYLPCAFDNTSNGSPPMFHGSVGKRLNELHVSFTSKMKCEFDSRTDIVCAHALGAELNYQYPGFHNRNRQIGQSEYIIAFTWSESTVFPKAGGTKHTWDNSATVNKIHVPLSSLIKSNPVIAAYNMTKPTTNNKEQNTVGLKRKEAPTIDHSSNANVSASSKGNCEGACNLTNAFNLAD